MRGIVNYTPLCIMIIVLQTTASEPQVLEKDVTAVLRLEGTLRNESSVSNPSVLIEGNGVLSGDFFRANYAWIPDFSRYYYIKECTQIRNNLWQIDLVCDVLMSFATGIKASMAIVQETTLEGDQRVNQYVANDSFARLVKDKTDIIQFPSGFDNDPFFILITAGGIVS